MSDRPLSTEELTRLDAWWRAANYLSVGQIYLRDNPLLREPLTLDHVKPRLLGHWGTTPGLNLLYAHMNRAILARDLSAMYVTGPGHGGPGLVASTWLEGSYTDVYPDITRDEEGMRRLFRQFSFPGGIPSHVAPETPGSIHEGGELGYALVHAYGAVFDNPDQLALEQVRRPGARRRGAPGPAPQRLQDRQPHRARPHPRAGAARAHGGLRARTALRHLRRPGRRPPAACDRARRRAGRDRRDPAPRARRRARRAPALADARPAHAEGLDGPEGGRRQADRGHVALPPGPALRSRGQPRAREGARGVDALLPARGALRRRRAPARRGAGRPPRGAAPHGREPAHQRRHAAARPAPARLPRLRGRRAGAGADLERGDAGP